MVGCKAIADYVDLSRMLVNKFHLDDGLSLSARGHLPKGVAELGISWPGERQAMGFARGLETCDIFVGDYELIVGRKIGFYDNPDKLNDWQGGAASFTGGMIAHMAIDNRFLLENGYEGVREILLAKIADRKSVREIGQLEFENEDFLSAGLKCIDAAIALQARYLAEIRRRREAIVDDDLLRINDDQITLFERVPLKPANTFYEAVQSIYFTSILNTFDAGLMGLGRLDQDLLGYYERDIAAGILTRDRAVEILGAFFIKLSELMWVPMSIMVGGKDREGKCAVNELSYLMLEAADLVRLHNPSLGIAVDDDTPADLLEFGSRMVASGYGHPAFFNDDLITDGLISYGVSKEDARGHLHCTCTEMTPSGCSGIWVVADYINFAQMVVDLMSEAKGGESLDDLVQVVKDKLAVGVRENCKLTNSFAVTRKAQGAFPFLSLFVNDCLERELDIERGGARYYYFYPQLVGLPTVVDSLMAIKKVVFDDGLMSLRQFADVVASNFEGADEVRQLVLNRASKYGTNDDVADGLANELVEFYYDEVSRYTNPYGFNYVPGFLSWIMHWQFGKSTSATPDGRLCGQAMSDSLASVAGMARRGLTAMLETVEKIDLSKAMGAVVVNVTIPVGSADEKTVTAITHLIRGHFAKGGFELQFNVMDKKLLEAAKKEPEKFGDVLVRVGGYSDYFVNLGEELQAEILRRFD